MCSPFSVSGPARASSESCSQALERSAPHYPYRKVLSEGMVIAGIGVTAGLVIGFVLERTIGQHFAELRVPGVMPLLLSAFLILAAAVIASAHPAVRASRVDPSVALRSE